MSLARLLPAALLLGSLPAFAQDHPKGRLPGNALSGPCWVPPSTLSEPWRILPNRSPDLGSGQAPSNRIPVDQHRFSQSEADCIHHFMWDGHPASMVVRSDRHLYSDTTCYAIRSYLVARDDEDSDSTHPVKSSTCQPAKRYHLKNADASAER
jgi:hypothetical protein